MEEKQNPLILFVKIIVALSIFAIVSYLVYFGSKDKTKEQKNSHNVQKMEYCYENEFISEYSLEDINYRDYYTLVITTLENSASGELTYLPSQKDKKTGEIEGNIIKDYISNQSMFLGVWTVSAEGETYEENLAIVFSANEAKVFEGLKSLDKNISNFEYSMPNLILPKIDCDDVYERQEATKTFLESFDSLITHTPELGGTFYPVLVYVDTLNDTLHCVYEDGHVQYSESFIYTYLNNRIFFEKSDDK